MKRLLSLASILAVLGGVAVAQEQPTYRAGGILDGSIKAMERVPTQHLTVLQTDGVEALTVMTDNGRFVMVGKLFDTWTMKELTSVDEVRAAASRVDFSAFKLNMDELAPFRIGNGPKRVQVFVDPRCPSCHELMSKMQALAKEGQYTFEILVVAALGRESERAARLVSCAADKDQAMTQLLAGRVGSDLPQVAVCDMAPIQKRLVTAQIVGVKGVPMTIAQDGRILRGDTNDLAGWLKGAS
jgi:thiol:disulfide interchange protein DsbC